MKKVTLLSIVVFAAIVLLLDFSEGTEDLDFFEILDKTTAEYLMGESTESKHLHRSASSGAAAISAPRNNRFLEASMQIIRGMAEAKTRRRLSSTKERLLARTIQKAVRDREIPKARQMIGHLIRPECHCPPEQGRCRKSDLPRHCRKKKPNKQKNILKKIRALLDETDFDILLGISGDVSLIFVIDTTGSMGDEIDAAKKIAQAIAAHPRDEAVNFILSPFGDPTWGNTFKCPDETSFVEALDTLMAAGGQDCPELTYNGIIDAIERGDPIPGSPMFLFTDAGAKEGDRPKYTLDNARGLALKYRTPVNFFYSTESGSCGSFQSHRDTLGHLMESTGGFGLQFNSSGEIQKMGPVVSAALDGTVTIHEGRSSEDGGRLNRRASARDKTYSLPVDDTVQSLIVTYFASAEADLVELRNPDRLPQPRKENLAQGGVWIINNPTQGLWELFIPAEVGTHSFKVTSSSSFNLEFDHLFLLRKMLGGRWNEYLIDYPLLGKTATVNLTIPLKKRLNLPSLRLSLVDESGRVLQNVNLDTRSLVGTFLPPQVPFKFKLYGRTAGRPAGGPTGEPSGGRPFQRISRNFVNAKNVLLRLQSGQGYKTLECGRTLRLPFVLDYNGVKREIFDVSVNSSLVTKTATNATKHAIEIRYLKTVQNVMSDTEVFFTVSLITPRDVSGFLDEWNTIKVTVKKIPASNDADVTSFIDHFKVTCSP